MSRRKHQIFNLSFLDLITGALGAVIFLFVITPKGGHSAAEVRQVAMYVDTAEMKLFGTLDDSLRAKRVGDTLLTVLVDYKNYPKPEKRKVEEKKTDFNQPKSTPKAPTPRKTSTVTPTPSKSQPEPKKPAPIIVDNGPKQAPEFAGDAPSVPCKVSFEVNWANQDDNVDFFVCKGNDCVYGGRKKDRSIGQWDSGLWLVSRATAYLAMTCVRLRKRLGSLTASFLANICYMLSLKKVNALIHA